MNKRWIIVCLTVFLTVGVTYRCPAPLIFTPGEGWSYETPGSAGEWLRDRAEDQYNAAQEFYDKNDYKTSLKAAKRVIREWPFSDFAPGAQYLSGLSYEALNREEKAFVEYQRLLDTYPTSEHYDDSLERQFGIANKYLAGKKFRLWGLFPLYKSMKKTTEMYQNLIDNGPYSDVAPKAQMNIGTAKENQKKFAEAVKVYEKAADKYNKQPGIVSDALYRAGMALLKEAKTAEYDQGAASKAIDIFTDFIALFPDDNRLEEARGHIDELRVEQARGSLMIARFYDKKNAVDGALTYYNDVVDILNRLLNDPDHPFAIEAKERITKLKKNASTPASVEATTDTAETRS
ncbi:tetratricopeptide repeat protein [bacterium]|nr:tetratricopeptide repeat protein [bacterium]